MNLHAINNSLQGIPTGKIAFFSDRRSSDLILGTLITNDYKNGTVVTLSDGRTLKLDKENYRNIWLDQNGEAGYSVAWCGPLPNLPSGEVEQYVRTLSNMQDRPFLIQISKVEDDNLTGHFVTHSSENFDGDDTIELPAFEERDGVVTVDLPITIPIYRPGNRQEKMRPNSIMCDIELHPGDIIATDVITIHRDNGNSIADIKSGRTTFTDKIKILKSKASHEDLRALLLLDMQEESVTTPNDDTGLLVIKNSDRLFKDLKDIEHELWIADLREQPDEAIVLWLNSDYHYSTSPFVLDTRGYLAAAVDNFNDYIESHEISEGLWLMKNITMNGGYDYEGNYDCELNADYIPATKEDLERFGLDAGTIGEDILDSLDGREVNHETSELADFFMNSAKLSHEKCAPAPPLSP